MGLHGRSSIRPKIIINGLAKLSEWLTGNKLSLSVKKTKLFMLFHTPDENY